MTHHSHDRHAHAHHHDSLAELLDLDALVMQPFLSEATNWVRELATVRPPRRALDVGAGTGTGTLALAERFPEAHLVAADLAPEMLQRVQRRAADGLLAERVSTAQIDFNGKLPEWDAFDLVWASASLHELAEPDRTLGALFGVLNPGGMIAVIEMDGPPLFLPAELGNGLEARLHEAVRTAQPGSNNYPDWSENLGRAGFAMLEKKAFSLDLAIDADDPGRLYAQTYLRRIQPVVAPHISDADRELLELLLADSGPASLRHRDDLQLRAGRTAWAARRP